MKRCFSAALLLLFAIASQAQPKPDFKRKGAPVPPFVIQQLTGRMLTNAVLQKGKPTVVVIFSPECDHCAKALDSFRMMAPLLRGKQIILVTQEIHKDKLREFLQKAGYDKEPLFKNVGWDKSDFIFSIYNYGLLPQFNVYSLKGALTASFTGNFPMDSLKMFLR